MKRKSRSFLIGPPQGTAKDVAIEFGRLVRRTAFELRLLDEIVVGAEIGVAIVFVGRAVKVVSAALGDQSNLRSRGNSFICALVAGGDAKFLNRVERDGQDRSKCVTAFVIGGNAVDA